MFPGQCTVSPTTNSWRMHAIMLMGTSPAVSRIGIVASATVTGPTVIPISAHSLHRGIISARRVVTTIPWWAIVPIISFWTSSVRSKD